jgi:nitrate reductase gamma subunit
MLVFFLGFVPFLYALALLAWQGFAWLHTGAWVALPMRLLVDPSLLANPKLASIAPFIPSVDWVWANHPESLLLANKLLALLLDRVHIGVLAALAGYAMMALGREIAARQAEIVEWQERQRADRLRRIAEYCRQ